jgi:hypothetical protein
MAPLRPNAAPNAQVPYVAMVLYVFRGKYLFHESVYMLRLWNFDSRNMCWKTGIMRVYVPRATPTDIVRKLLAVSNLWRAAAGLVDEGRSAAVIGLSRLLCSLIERRGCTGICSEGSQWGGEHRRENGSGKEKSRSRSWEQHRSGWSNMLALMVSLGCGRNPKCSPGGNWMLEKRREKTVFLLYETGGCCCWILRSWEENERVLIHFCTQLCLFHLALQSVNNLVPIRLNTFINGSHVKLTR